MAPTCSAFRRLWWPDTRSCYIQSHIIQALLTKKIFRRIDNHCLPKSHMKSAFLILKWHKPNVEPSKMPYHAWNWKEMPYRPSIESAPAKWNRFVYAENFQGNPTVMHINNRAAVYKWKAPNSKTMFSLQTHNMNIERENGFVFSRTIILQWYFLYLRQ